MGKLRVGQASVAVLALASLLMGAAALPSGQPSVQTVGPADSTTFAPVAPAGAPQAAANASAPLAFGLDAGSVDAQLALGLRPDYATLWIGDWNLKYGWLEPDAQLAHLRALNVTPAVHFYYWGDDIAPECFTTGCNGKDMAGWTELGRELGQHLAATMGNASVLVLLETEFNKASVATSETLDAALAQRADELHAADPHVQVALSLGDWNRAAWPTWDRAAAASDYVGTQAMTAATRDAPETRDALPNNTLDAARALHALFGKPVVVQDVAIGSYPEPQEVAPQAATLGRLLGCLPTLKQAGVQAILYRSLADARTMDTANYFGEAERHFGLAWNETALKPAGQAWVAAMAAERAQPVAAADGSC